MLQDFDGGNGATSVNFIYDRAGRELYYDSNGADTAGGEVLVATIEEEGFLEIESTDIEVV